MNKGREGEKRTERESEIENAPSCYLTLTYGWRDIHGHVVLWGLSRIFLLLNFKERLDNIEIKERLVEGHSAVHIPLLSSLECITNILYNVYGSCLILKAVHGQWAWRSCMEERTIESEAIILPGVLSECLRCRQKPNQPRPTQRHFMHNRIALGIFRPGFQCILY